jgi:hypothetical protein
MLDHQMNPLRRFVQQSHPDAVYGFSDFKRDVTAQLVKKYGSAVKPGSKAIFVNGEGVRRNTDVIVAVDYRRYFKFNNTSDSSYSEGAQGEDSRGPPADGAFS